MAGVGGSAFYLVLSVAGVSNQWIFALQASREGWLGGGKGMSTLARGARGLAMRLSHVDGSWFESELG